MAKSDERWCITQAEIASVSYTWTIKNFSFFANSDVIHSSTFSSSTANDIKWYINLHPNGYNENSRDYVSIFLYSKCSSKNEALATASVSILASSKAENIVSKLSELRKFGEKSGGWGWHQFIKKADLTSMADVLLPNDVLTMHCQVKFMVELFTASGDTSVVKIPECRLKFDFLDLLQNETLSDVTFVVGGKKFNSHRNILAARSRVFSAMFRLEMKEKNEKIIDIPCIDSDVFYKMLYFIYTGETPDLTTIKPTCELLEIADKYDLYRLKSICEDFLCSQLTVENVSEMIAFADFHGADQLKSNASRFMQMNIDAVQNTKSWISLFRKPQCHLEIDEDEEIGRVSDVSKD